MEIHNKASINDVTMANKLVILDFYAPWCGPCKVLEGFLKDEIKRHHVSSISLYKANVDDLNILDVTIGGKKISITSLPTLVFCKNGEALQTIVGVNKVAIQQAIEKYI